MKNSRLPILALALLLSQCKKSDPESSLPPETQTGANTFGCLVNGQPWQPGGNDGTSNYSVAYDYSYAQGTLSVGTYRLTGSGSDQQTLGFSSDSLRTTGTYKLNSMGHNRAAFVSRATKCTYITTDPGTYCKGTFEVV